MTRLQLILMPHRREYVCWPHRDPPASRPGVDFSERTPGSGVPPSTLPTGGSRARCESTSIAVTMRAIVSDARLWTTTGWRGGGAGTILRIRHLCTRSPRAPPQELVRPVNFRGEVEARAGYSSGSLTTAGSRSSSGSASPSSSSASSSSSGSRGGIVLPMMVTLLQSTNQVETFSGMLAVISAPVGRRDVYGRMLARELEGQLSAIAVLAPAAPWRPWADDRDLHGRPGQPFLALRSPAHRSKLVSKSRHAAG
jgi:hypothetical protein